MSHDDLLDIQAQERAKADREERERIAAKVEIDDLKWLMSNARGRRLVYAQLERAGVWRSSFNTNALSMAFSEGVRNEGLRLIAKITEHCPERYAEMLTEHRKK